jgi:EF-hand domain
MTTQTLLEETEPSPSPPHPSPSAIKMDELLVGWLGRDDVYDNVLQWIDKFKMEQQQQLQSSSSSTSLVNPSSTTASTTHTPPNVATTTTIPPFYPLRTATGTNVQRRRRAPLPYETWEAPAVGPLSSDGSSSAATVPPKAAASTTMTTSPFLLSETPDDELQQDQQLQQQQQQQPPPKGCVKDQFLAIVEELGLDPFALSSPTSTDDGIIGTKPSSGSTDNDKDDPAHVDIPLEAFVRVTKELCRFPSFFNASLYQRILDLWNARDPAPTTAAAAPAAATTSTTTMDALDKSIHNNHKAQAVNLTIFEWFWKTEMEPYDAEERLFRLLKQPHENCILRDDLLPYIKALLSEHPVRSVVLGGVLGGLCRFHCVVDPHNTIVSPSCFLSGPGILVQSC